MAKSEEKPEGKKAKKHLHEIRTQSAGDGTYVHHHTYKAKASDAHTEPERQNVATSSSADEAGEHVAEQMAMNQGGGDPSGGDPSAGGDPGAGAAPDAGAAAGAMAGA